jgi:hypothetical protein
MAAAWLNDPERRKGAGTLSHVILDLAERYAIAVAARDAVERQRVRGEIVGFAYRVENPADAQVTRLLLSRERTLRVDRLVRRRR